MYVKAVLGAALGTGVLVATVGCGGGGHTQSEADIIARAKPSVVRIYGKDWAGSGVVIDAERGLVLTNAHVAVGLSGMKARVGDDASTETPAQLVGAAPCEDLAVIRLVNRPPDLQAIHIGDSSEIKAGDHVTALGYPGTLEAERGSGAPGQAENVVATDGRVSQANVPVSPSPSMPEFPQTILHQAPVNPGNSGGPLLNDEGELIGINTLTNPGAEGNVQSQFYSISINRASRIYPDLEAGRSRAYVGFADLAALSETSLAKIFAEDPDYSSLGGARLGQRVQQLLEQHGIGGVYVWGTQAGSTARKAGIGYGDLLTALDGTSVTKVSDVCDVLQSTARGQQVQFEGYHINSGTTMDDVLVHFGGELHVR
jgi:S1-C subfamily serine protease